MCTGKGNWLNRLLWILSGIADPSQAVTADLHHRATRVRQHLLFVVRAYHNSVADIQKTQGTVCQLLACFGPFRFGQVGDNRGRTDKIGLSIEMWAR